MSLIRTMFITKRMLNLVNMRAGSSIFMAKTGESRSMSTISRYPVPERSSLPEDLQQVMNEVEEKVCVIYTKGIKRITSSSC